jgi:hypothetical protein
MVMWKCLFIDQIRCRCGKCAVVRVIARRNRNASLQSPFAVVSRNGAARGIRTPDPLITNEVLYQLSYCGTHLPLNDDLKLVQPSES